MGSNPTLSATFCKAQSRTVKLQPRIFLLRPLRFKEHQRVLPLTSYMTGYWSANLDFGGTSRDDTNNFFIHFLVKSLNDQ